ncbi:hypothetical protein VdG2_07299 [Verticillium dahliae VDG2]|nr:hypothetical protein VdG2_07299 [Verticillium dahliae VDG2]
MALPGSWYWWGNFHIGTGYHALWFYLETGEVLISWNMEADRNGVSTTASASVWHPSSLHETIPVVPESRASETSTSRQPG